MTLVSRPRTHFLAAMMASALCASLTLAWSQQTQPQPYDGRPQPLFPDVTPACPCESLTNLSLPNTTIDSASVDTNGVCRINATVRHPPAPGELKVFIALPTKDWNGRFRGTGGGGYYGGSPNALSGPAAQGYAAGATDTGHEGGDPRFALDADGRLNWPAIQDFAYRGIHEMTVTGKALARAFYGKSPRYSYFVGSSTGGRQGLMEAQRFPDDYDGIISGCPAIHWHRFIPAILWPQVAMLTAGNFVSKAKLDAATAAAIAACDQTDGVADGVIDDPMHCTYDPKALVGTRVGDSLFTDADAEVIRQIWAGPRAPNGSFLWYGLTPGSDLSALAGTEGSPLRGKPFTIPRDWLRFFILQNPQWDLTTLTVSSFELLWHQSVEEFGEVIGTDKPDLRPFRDRGGKIVITHGLADQLIPPQGSIDYYRQVQEHTGGPDRTAQFARLFLIPGVDHGFRGAGPGPVGLQDAIIRWVEDGRAPERLLTEKRDSNGGVTRTRPIFPYPRVAKYKGSGSTDDAANFVSASATE